MFAGNGSYAGRGSCASASASFSASASASSASASALPVVVWHGFFDSCSNDKSVGYLRAAVRGVLPDVFFHSICVKEEGVRDISSSIFGSIDQQIDEVCASLAAIPQLAGGFNAIGISQGGLLFRAYVQRCNSPPVRTLITLGSPHAGMAALPYCGPSRESDAENKEELNHAGCMRGGDDDDVAANATCSASVSADWEGESTWQEEGEESGGLSSLGGVGVSALRVLAASSNGLSGFSGGLSGLSSGSGSLSGFSGGLISFSGGISGGSFAGSSEIAGSVTWAVLSGLGTAIDFCKLLKPHMHQIYQPWVQKFFMPAQYFRLWRHMDRYLQRSAFLADINNERGPTRRNETYAANVRSLERFVLVRWEDETMISPPQSSWFWSHDRFGNLLPLQEQPMFAEDWLGLRTLHEKKKLHFTTMPGSHGIINPSLFAREFVSKYLVPEPAMSVV
ncbi:unnamed protein product [Closterium sp. NIES-64]|nr:unnamed protein product [Closterium sp. NIES-64]CAI5990731.1 unnamed protein product [Closterium sp. NIES-65]